MKDAGNYIQRRRKLTKKTPRSVHRGSHVLILRRECGVDALHEFVARESKKPVNRRDIVHDVSTIEFKNSLQAAAEWWQDEEVLQRISLENDLVAAEARYHHHSCSMKFLKKRDITGSQLGRPEDADVSLAFTYICKYIEENEYQCQLTLSEILEGFKGFVPTHKALLKKLKKSMRTISLSPVEGLKISHL